MPPSTVGLQTLLLTCLLLTTLYHYGDCCVGPLKRLKGVTSKTSNAAAPNPSQAKAASKAVAGQDLPGGVGGQQRSAVAGAAASATGQQKAVVAKKSAGAANDDVPPPLPPPLLDSQVPAHVRREIDLSRAPKPPPPLLDSQVPAHVLKELDENAKLFPA